MATRTIKAAGGNSNVAGTYEENAVPTAADDIVARADGTSGNFVIAANLACRSFNLTTSSVSGGTYSGSVTRTGGNLSIGTTTAPPSGIAFAIPATCSWNVVGSIIFLSTHTTMQTAYTNGVAINSPLSISGANTFIQLADASAWNGAWTINASGSKLQLGATITSTTSVTLSSGTLDVNSQSLSCTQLLVSNNAVTRVLAMGTNGSITTSAGSGLNAQGTVTNFSTTGSGTLTLTGGNAIANLRGADWSGTSNGIVIAFTGANNATLSHGTAGTAVGTVGGLTRTGTASKTCEFTLEGDVTIGGNCTFTGNSRANQLLARSLTRGTARTITCNGTVTVTNTDFRDLTGAGSGSWNFSGQTDVGNAQGNSGITFPASATQTLSGISGSNKNWSDVSVWTSRIPLPQDDVIVNWQTNSFFVDMSRLGRNVDFSGSTGGTVDFTVANEIHGNLVLGASHAMSGTTGTTFVGRSSHTITNNGKTFTNSVLIDAVSGSYSLADAFSTSRSSNNALTLTTGTFDANDMNVTFTGATAGFTGTSGTLNMGNGVWEFTGLTTTSTPWAIAAAITLNAEGSTLRFTSVTSANTKTIQAGAGGGKVYNIIETNGTVGTFNFSNAITINQWKAHGTHNVSITSTGTITIAASGVMQFDQGVSLKALTAGSAATVSAPASATITMSGGTITDITASGGATFVAYATNGGGNTGWTFNTTRTISNAGGNYNAYSTWVEGAIPTAIDDVVATGTSGNLVVNTNSVAKSIDFTNYVGTLSGNQDLTLGTSTVPPGGIVLRFSSGMTTTWTGMVNLSSTHGTTQTVVFNGKTHSGGITITTATIEFSDAASLVGAVVMNGTGTVKFMASVTTNNLTLNQGTLNINGQTVTQTSTSTGLVISNTSFTRVLAWGTGGLVLVPRTTAFLNVQSPTTGFSVTGTGTVRSTTTSTATVVLSGADITGTTIEQLTSGNLTFSDSGTISGINKVGVAGTASTLTFTSALTVAGNINIQGGDVAGRLLTTSLVYGTPVTITCNGTITSTYNAFRDITAAGSASWNFSAITDNSAVGNALGNTGITFAASVTCTDSGSTSILWSDASHWSPRVPLAHDDVISTRTAGTMTLDVQRLGRNVNFSGATGGNLNSGNGFLIYGSMTFGTLMSITGSPTFTYVGRGSHTFTSNGAVYSVQHIIDALTGTYSLSDALTTSRSAAGAFTITSGTFDANDFNMTFTGTNGAVLVSGGTLLMGNGTWSFTGNGTRSFWNVTGGTITCEGSTIAAPSGTGTSFTFAGGGKTYNRLQRVASSAGSLIITGANTFAQLSHTGGSTPTLILPASTTTTITSLLELKNGVTSLTSSSSGTPATISAAGSVTIDVVNATIKDSTVIGGASFVAYDSTDISGNTGWTFSVLESEGWGALI